MTTAILNLTVITVVAALCVRPLRRMAAGPLLLTALVISVLTLVFDTAMIAADLYVYDAAKISGIYVWGAPIEDFAYAIVASVAMPVLWTVLPAGKRAATTDADGAATS